jgi:hypothetical protein
MAEWLKATDCKSVHVSVRRFEPYSAHTLICKYANGQMCKLNTWFKVLFICKFAHPHICTLVSSGSSSFGRAIAFQAIGGQFEPGLPLFD